MNWLSIVKLVLQLGPVAVQLLEAILKAFNALPEEHQANLLAAIEMVAAKTPTKSA